MQNQNRNTQRRPKVYSKTGRFGTIRIDERNKTLSLKEQSWKFEFTKKDLTRWFGKGMYRLAILLVFSVATIAITFSRPSDAKVAQFYPTTCLGGWENPQLAQGAPDVLDGTDTWYDSSNSAMNRDTVADIYCGGFEGVVPDKTVVGTVKLSFSMYVGDVEDVEGVTYALLPTPNTPQTPETVIEPTDNTAAVLEGVDGGVIDPDTPTDVPAGTPQEGGDSVPPQDEVPSEELTDTTPPSNKEQVSLQGKDFASSVEDILNAPEGSDVSFTLTDDTESTPDEEVIVVPSGDDMTDSIYDIIDAPADQNISVTDDTSSSESVTYQGSLEDYFYQLLDAPADAVIQISDSPSEPQPAPEPQPEPEPAPEPTPEEPATEESPAEDAGPVSFLRNLFYAIVGRVNTVYATSSPAEEGGTTDPEPVVEPEPINTPVPEVQPPADPEPEVVDEPAPETPPEEDAPDDTPEQSTDSNTPEEPAVDTPAGTETPADTPAETLDANTPAEPAPAAIDAPAPEVVEDHVLRVEYSFNGTDWTPLGLVTAANWQNVSFELPIEDWSGVESMQVRLVRPVTYDPQPTVLLDAVVMEVKYFKEKKDKGDLERLSDKKGYKGNDDLVFDFSYRPGKKNLLVAAADQVSSVLFGAQDTELVIVRSSLVRSTGEREDVEALLEYGLDDAWSITVQPEKRILKPGKYILEVEVEDGGETYVEQQEFYWGVLTINVNKSIYEPNEEAYLQMGVLDDMGRTICDANVELVVRNPLGEDVTLTTADGGISYSDVCNGDTYVEIPDYFAYYTVGDPGVYQMRFTNLDTGYEILDNFEVHQVVPFVVERVGPTRIYPPATYEMQILIEAKQDFTGDIYEYMPDTFEVVSTNFADTSYVPPAPPAGAFSATSTSGSVADQTTNASGTDMTADDTAQTATQNDIASAQTQSTAQVEYKGSYTAEEPQTKELLWNVSMKTGDKVTLTYTFDAPDISPELFLLGPLEFYE